MQVVSDHSSVGHVHQESTYLLLPQSLQGVMFFLPLLLLLPLNKTLQTMDELEGGKMPDCPEVNIIVNGKPMANKTVWCSLVNIDATKEDGKVAKDQLVVKGSEQVC